MNEAERGMREEQLFVRAVADVSTVLRLLCGEESAQRLQWKQG